MRVLVLGGSWWLGRLLVEDFAKRGFEVAVFNRGLLPTPILRGVRHVRGDRKREEDLHRLAQSGRWDVVVDVSGKVPAVVQRSARALARVTERYVSVSTVQVNRDWPDAPVDEDSPLWHGDPNYDPGTTGWKPEEYGQLKVGCEMACRDAFTHDRLLILRLHAMLGLYEYIGPLQWWLERMRRGGPVLLPGPDRAIQPVDVRDVAKFLADQVERAAYGVFNVGAPADGRTYGAMVKFCGDLGAADRLAIPELVWADEDWLVEQGVRQWTELPLWCHAAAPWSVSVNRAIGAGLQCRPLAETIADVWHWLKTREAAGHQNRRAEYGIASAREAAIITRWREAGTGRNATLG